MPSRQFSITLTEELAAAVDGLASRRRQGRSALIELLLREHPYVRKAVQSQREKEPQGVAVRERRPKRDGERVEVA